MPAMMRPLVSVCLSVGLVLLSPVAGASPFAVPTIDDNALSGGGPADDATIDGDDAAEDDPVIAEARSEYKAGSDAYALGNYEEAVKHFERSYQLSQEPALLFNLGQSYTRWYDISGDVEHLKKARRLYENYVLNVGSTALDEQGQADARADAQARIAEVDRRIAKHEEDASGGTQEGPGPDKPKKPVHKKAWFWVVLIGSAAAVGGVVAAVVVTTRDDGFEPELGTLGRGGVGNGGLSLRF